MQSEAVQVSEIYLVAPDRDVVLQFAALAERVVRVRHPDMTPIAFYEVSPFLTPRCVEVFTPCSWGR